MGRHNQLRPCLDGLVAQIEQRQLPQLIAGNMIDVVNTNQFAACKAVENVGSGFLKQRQRDIGGAITGLCTDRLHQVSLAGSPASPNPATVTADACSRIPEGRDEFLVASIEKTIEYDR